MIYVSRTSGRPTWATRRRSPTPGTRRCGSPTGTSRLPPSRHRAGPVMAGHSGSTRIAVAVPGITGCVDLDRLQRHGSQARAATGRHDVRADHARCGSSTRGSARACPASSRQRRGADVAGRRSGRDPGRCRGRDRQRDGHPADLCGLRGGHPDRDQHPAQLDAQLPAWRQPGQQSHRAAVGDGFACRRCTRPPRARRRT